MKTFELKDKTSEKHAKWTQNDLTCCVVFAKKRGLVAMSVYFVLMVDYDR